MWLLIRYIKDHSGVFWSFLFLWMAFLVIFKLYSVPVTPVLYGGFLGMFAGCVCFGWGFYQYCKKHQHLNGLKEEILVTLENLPEEKKLLAQDYKALIEKLYAGYTSLENENFTAQNDLKDYYALWAHQIKTPIFAIQAMVQAGHKAGRERELLQEIWKIESYVEMALQFARLESNTMDLRIERQPLLPIVNRAVKRYSKVFLYKKIRLEINFNDIIVLTDMKWFSYLLEQILSNALKYSEAGGVITIELKEEKVLVIKDTGRGIKKEDLPRIFDRGYTGYNGRGNGQSTGIGLYMANRIAAMLRHKLWVVSEYKKGTEVCIDLHFDPLPMD